MLIASRRNSTIRVLLIAPSLKIVGGQAVQASRLMEALRKEPSLTISFQPIDHRFPGALSYLQRWKFVRTFSNWAVYIANLLARVWRYDILHVFSASYSSYMLWTVPAMVIGKIYRKRVVVNYRDGQAENHLKNWRTAIPTLRFADEVVAPSEYLIDVFAQFGLRIRAISNIIDVSQFKYRRRGRLRPVFLHNRSLERLYNVPCSLRAFRLVQEQYPDASLIVAHNGPLRAELEQLASELEARNTQFIGVVPYARLKELYDAADIYFTSPDFDCMPGSILECFASGLPVVATNSGGIPYIAKNEETALLVEPGDHEAMAKAALRLLQEPELAERISTNAYQSCLRYSEDSVREQWTALYRELVTRDHGRAHAQRG